MSDLTCLRFGIPSLDFLFSYQLTESPAAVEGRVLVATGHGGAKSPSKVGANDRVCRAIITAARPAHGIQLPRKKPGDPEGVTSLCIAGPSGSGKSLLAMHLASRYYADCAVLDCWPNGHRPTIVYVSTDLTYARAQDTWRSFALHLPNRRASPYPSEDVPAKFGLGTPDRPSRQQHSDICRRLQFEVPDLRVELREGSIHCMDELVEVLERPAHSSSNHNRFTPGLGEILFLNLAESTAGDDWSFVTKVVSLLRPLIEPKVAPPHLLIVDAVEGLEMMVGSTDEYGQQRSRRSRIAQLLRSAVGKCHVVLVLEEHRDLEHPPEEFVTDVVLRLRNVQSHGYLRRSLEVVKSRGTSSIRGFHNYIIRSAKPRKDRNMMSNNYAPDDPCLVNPDGTVTSRRQSYIQVFHSLHSLSRNFMSRASNGSASNGRVASFNTPELPRILLRNGFPEGQVTFITGDEATHKGRFARAFLAGCFQKPRSLGDRLSIRRNEQGRGVAVLITTGNLSRQSAIERIASHVLNPTENPQSLSKRFIYRQLELHDISSSVLFHIIRRCIEAAIELGLEQSRSPKRTASGHKSLEARFQYRNWWEPCAVAKRVRLVIDDWAVIQSTYPAVAADELLLPFLIRYLERVGVTTLIVETRPGRPDQVFSTGSERHFRSVHNNLLTWHVPFYGEDRVAVAAVPPLSDKLPSVVAELRTPHLNERNEDELDERLCGDPHFQLYRGLEGGKPELVPLSVRLFAGASGFPEYATLTNATLNELFIAYSQPNVVSGLDPKGYSNLRDFSFLHSGTRIEHTVVLSVDEYWSSRGGDSSQSVCDYLDQQTYRSDQGIVATNDPYATFQLEASVLGKMKNPSLRKADFFLLKHSYGKALEHSKPSTKLFKQSWGNAGDQTWHLSYDNAGLVPYVWDFGFLLLRERAWSAARGAGALSAQEQKLVENVWRYCVSPRKPDGRAPLKTDWEMFLRACSLVAQVCSARAPRMLSFDTELLTTQTFVCLLLELWFSEIRKNSDNLPFCETRLGCKQETASERRLTYLLYRHALEFFKVWLLLGETMDPMEIVDERGALLARGSQNQAVAERHWYSTASHLWKKAEGDLLRPGRLPGQYITRGDWFLTIAPESRSHRLGERAIDLLSRRSANLARLEHGIGLPVRDILFDHEQLHIQEAEKAKRYRCIDTAVGTVDSTGFPRLMNYQELRDLAVAFPWADQDPGSPDKTKLVGHQLRWLWRSQIPDYHRHDRVFERWSGRFLRAAAGWNQSLHSAGTSGFDVYALLNANTTALSKGHQDVQFDLQKLRSLKLKLKLDASEIAAREKRYLPSRVVPNGTALLSRPWKDYCEMLQVFISELEKFSFRPSNSVNR